MSISSLSEQVAGPPMFGRGRTPVLAVFFVIGAVSTTWAARLPAIRAHLHLSDQALGLILLGPAAGAALAMPIAGALLRTRTPRRVVLAAMLPMAVSLPFITVAGNGAVLALVFFVWGFAVGLIDVSMNTEAVGVEQRMGRRVMAGLHGGYSIGGLAGAAVGALCAAAEVSVRVQLVVVCAVVAVIGLVAGARFEPVADAAIDDVSIHPRRLRWSWALVALAAMASASFLAEGAANDWSAVYLHSSLGASPGIAGAGYTCFAVSMAVGRLFGDRLADRWSPRRLVRVSASLGALGWGAALLVGSAPATFVGLLLLGLGLSPVVPNVFSRTSSLGQAAPALAIITFCGYGGLLAGPAVIGALAAAIGLASALSVTAGLAALIAVLAGVLSRESS